MSVSEPAEAARRDEWRRARRAAVRLHHPDTGGDPDELRAALHAVDRRFAGYQETTQRTGPPPSARRRLRRVSRAVRSRLPRRWPGSRRYIDIG